jgi:hypothetical protein
VVTLGGMFWTDSGRNVLLSCVTSFLETKNIILRIDGVDKKVTKIREIYIHLPSGLELFFSNIILSRKSLLNKSSAYVGTFTLRKPSTVASAAGSIDAVSVLMELKFFLKDLFIEKAILNLENKIYLLNDFNYRSEKNEDFLSFKINETILAEITINLETMNYRLAAQNDIIKIRSRGVYKDFMTDIRIDSAAVEYQNHVYGFCGNLYPTAKRIILKTKIDIEDLPNFNAIPFFISKSFKDVSGSLDIDCNFSKELACVIHAVFNKSETILGGIDCIYKNNRAEIVGDVEWINIFGYNFSTLKCKIDDEKNTEIHLVGKDFEINTDIKFSDNILVKKLELSNTNGFLKSTQPFFVNDNPNCSFTFDFSQLSFLNKITPIFGAGRGNFTYKDRKFSGQGDFAKLFFQNHEFYSLSICGNRDNFQLTAEQGRVFGLRMGDLRLKISGQYFTLSSKINDDGTLKAVGEISESFKKISLKEGKISLPNNEIRLDTCILDAAANNHRIKCTLYDKKEPGEAQLNLSSQEIFCAFKAFPLARFLKLFDWKFPICRLDGDLKLKLENKNFVGNGKMTLSKLAAHKQNLEINLGITNAGTKVHANLKNKNDLVEISAFFPILLRNDGSISRNAHSNLLDCRIVVNAQLERLLELPDSIVIRGCLDGNFLIAGNFSNPTISGKAQLKKAYIAVKDILLKDGLICLTADGNNIISAKGEFMDYKRKKATISGEGRLFFNETIPNINTNLHLKFDNFALFDSDDLKIDIDGEGTMNGPLQEMLIRGKVLVPKCRIQDLTFVENELELLIENDIYLNNNPKNKEGSSFFKYDVSMHCPNIEFVGKIFNIFLKGDLELSSYREKGTLAGELKLCGGKLDLFGKRMMFTKGEVVFLKEFPFEPKASLSCQRNLGNINVMLDIKNSPRKGISLNLHSSPSYSIEMILSKMLFGKESKYLSVSEAVQLANVITSFKQRGYIFSVLNTFQDMGVIDNVSFACGNDQSTSLYSNSQNISSPNNINVSAGKYIHDNVYISINKKDNGASFDIDFSVTPKTSIKANTKGEVGLSWKYRY